MDDTGLQRFAQNLQHFAIELGQLVQKQYPMMRQADFPWPRIAAAPTRATAEAVWCGERKGRTPQLSKVKPPAVRERTAALSKASSSGISGKMPGKRAANIDLPVPGGPISNRLWRPAAATSKAWRANGRLDVTQIRITWPSLGIARPRAAWLQELQTVEKGAGLKQSVHAIQGHALQHRGFLGTGLRQDKGAAGGPRLASHGQGAAHWSQCAGQCQFAGYFVLGQGGATHLAARHQNADGDGQVEAA